MIEMLELINPNPDLGSVSLDTAGLIAIADLEVITRRTAMVGSASIFDVLVLAPGLHKQQNATELAKGENPPCAALTTGYVFRVENPATVYHLQQIGKTGHLVRLSVKKLPKKHLSYRFGSLRGGLYSSILFFICPLLTIFTLFFLIIALRDVWASCSVSILILARLLNFLVIRKRSEIGWKGKNLSDYNPAVTNI